MPKLNDTQLVILSAAARREDGAALPLPKSLKISSAAITKSLESLSKKGLLEDKPASREAAARRERKDGRRMVLVITDAGMRAIGAHPGLETDKAPATTKAPSPARRQGGTRRTADRSSKTETAPSGSRPVTKQSLLIDLLSRESGALKKKLGFAITSEKVDGHDRVYRIVEGG